MIWIDFGLYSEEVCYQKKMQSATYDDARSCKCFDKLIKIIFSVENRESLVFDTCSFLYFVCIAYVAIMFPVSFGYRDIHHFVSFLVSMFDIFDDFWQKLFRIFVEIDNYIFFSILHSAFCILNFFSRICEKTGVHEEFHVIESVCFHVVNSLYVSCEDMFRPFEKIFEEESIEKFFGLLDSSHEITRFLETGEE